MMKQEEIDRIVNAVRDEYGKMFDPKEGVNWNPLLEEIIVNALRTLHDPPQINLQEVEKLVRYYVLEKAKLGGSFPAIGTRENEMEHLRNCIGYTIADIKQEGENT